MTRDQQAMWIRCTWNSGSLGEFYRHQALERGCQCLREWSPPKIQPTTNSDKNCSRTDITSPQMHPHPEARVGPLRIVKGLGIKNVPDSKKQKKVQDSVRAHKTEECLMPSQRWFLGWVGFLLLHLRTYRYRDLQIQRVFKLLEPFIPYVVDILCH
mgnify:CR=1 FL=1